jgi:hypothetical protein
LQDALLHILVTRVSTPRAAAPATTAAATAAAAAESNEGGADVANEVIAATLKLSNPFARENCIAALRWASSSASKENAFAIADAVAASGSGSDSAGGVRDERTTMLSALFHRAAHLQVLEDVANHLLPDYGRAQLDAPTPSTDWTVVEDVFNAIQDVNGPAAASLLSGVLSFTLRGDFRSDFKRVQAAVAGVNALGGAREPASSERARLLLNHIAQFDAVNRNDGSHGDAAGLLYVVMGTLSEIAQQDVSRIAPLIAKRLQELERGTAAPAGKDYSLARLTLAWVLLDLGDLAAIEVVGEVPPQTADDELCEELSRAAIRLVTASKSLTEGAIKLGESELEAIGDAPDPAARARLWQLWYQANSQSIGHHRDQVLVKYRARPATLD